MFSLRRDQFRAILLSILIADALSHRQLPWSLTPFSRWQTYRKGTVASAPVAVASDHWCQQITTVLRHLTEDHSQPFRLEFQPFRMATDQTTATEGIDAILLAFSQWLPSLACINAAVFSERMEATLPNAIEPNSRTAMEAFYQAAAALLAGDTSVVAAIGSEGIHAAPAPESSLELTVVQSCKQVCLANGDFTLTIAQSLRSSPPLSGLPIFSGVLSACWLGTPGIPTRWSHPLLTPPHPLQRWLQRRWHIEDAIALYQWGARLNDLWLGRPSSSCHTIPREDHPAVQFAIKSASWPHFR